MLKELIISTMLLLGSHEGGHQLEADRLNEHLIWSSGSWSTNASNEHLSLIGGAGFAMQDNLGIALNNQTYNKINTLHKLSYIIYDRGDIKSINADSAKLILGISMLYDNVLFDINSNGTPLLVYHIQFD